MKAPVLVVLMLAATIDHAYTLSITFMLIAGFMALTAR